MLKQFLDIYKKKEERLAREKAEARDKKLSELLGE